MIEYDLVRQHRKTMAIYITKEARVLVKAPKFITKKEVDSFVNEKRMWIEKHLEHRTRLLNQKAKYKPYYGEVILFMGKEIPVLTMKEKGMNLTQDALYLQENADERKTDKAFKKLAKDFALDYYGQRISYYGEKMKLNGYSIRVNNAKSQWGSCNSKKVISLSLRLIGANQDLIDYVIVHELAHLVYMDHQDKFWSLVASIVPEYKEKRQSLKLYQQKITTEIWL